MEHTTIAKFYKNYSKDSGKVYLYGASITGQGILQLLEKFSVKVEAFVDRNPDKCRELFCGYKVILPEEVPKDACVVIATSMGSADSVDKMLIEEYEIAEIYYFELESIVVKHHFFINGYDANQIENYEKQYQQLTEKYDSIVIYPMWADRIGELCYRYMVMQQDIKDRNDNTYRVILPYTCPVNSIPYANTRLLDIVFRQYPVIYRDNEELWAYIIAEHITDIEFHNTYIHTLKAYSEIAKLPWKRALQYSKGEPPIIHFSKEEEKEAEEKAKRLGIKEPFVCVFARDSSYLAQREGDWSYHDYRDSDINNYKLMADYLKKKNIQVVRVGAISTGQIKSDNVVDITNDNYDELLDLYLNARCSLWVGPNSGAEMISGMFRRPKVIVNRSHIIDATWSEPYCLDDSCCYIPKLYYHCKEQRYLGIREICELNLSGIVPSRYEQECGVRLVENTPEDILELYQEYDKKQGGIWEYTEEENILQNRYREVLAKVCKEHPEGMRDYVYATKDCIIPIPIGSTFLGKYQDFLLD